MLEKLSSQFTTPLSGQKVTLPSNFVICPAAASLKLSPHFVCFIPSSQVIAASEFSPEESVLPVKLTENTKLMLVRISVNNFRIKFSSHKVMPQNRDSCTVCMITKHHGVKQHLS